ncbi:hypothetical protein ACFYV7_31965 [Nocardia suismassiliense]|uniref:Uncharacterized protein n=1 Tax=Nocardia suismassiliense TaxID=2077092 RepID=A0ABW6R1R1_9NOCA
MAPAKRKWARREVPLGECQPAERDVTAANGDGGLNKDARSGESVSCIRLAPMRWVPRTAVGGAPKYVSALSAVGHVSDNGNEAEALASYLTTAPEDMLNAVVGLRSGDATARVSFEAEPTAYVWLFDRTDANVHIRLVTLASSDEPDAARTELWSTTQTLDHLVCTVIGAFEDVARQHGDDGYLKKWCGSFPHAELQALVEAQPNTRRD